MAASEGARDRALFSSRRLCSIVLNVLVLMRQNALERLPVSARISAYLRTSLHFATPQRLPGWH